MCFFQSIYFILEACLLWDFPGDPVVKTPCPQHRGARVRSLVRELRSHMQRGMAKRKDIKEGEKRKKKHVLYIIKGGEAAFLRK